MSKPECHKSTRVALCIEQTLVVCPRPSQHRLVAMVAMAKYSEKLSSQLQIYKVHRALFQLQRIVNLVI